MTLSIPILGICGSLRGQESFTRKLLVHVMQALPEAGGLPDLLDLADLPLPLCKAPEDLPDHPGTAELRRRVLAAQALVLATPEYHNSFSGVLKNALDLLSEKELGGKTFGLIGIAGGDMGAVNALSHLRTVVRGVGGHCIPQQISLPSVYRQFDGDTFTDARVPGRVRDFAAALVRISRLHASGGE